MTDKEFTSMIDQTECIDTNKFMNSVGGMTSITSLKDSNNMFYDIGSANAYKKISNLEKVPLQRLQRDMLGYKNIGHTSDTSSLVLGFSSKNKDIENVIGDIQKIESWIKENYESLYEAWKTIYSKEHSNENETLYKPSYKVIEKEEGDETSNRNRTIIYIYFNK